MTQTSDLALVVGMYIVHIKGKGVRISFYFVGGNTNVTVINAIHQHYE